MEFRFVAYDPKTDQRLYQLPRTNSVQIGDTFGTRGTLELKYSANAIDARDLPTFLKVQAEVTFDEGHTWAEIGPSLLRLSGEHEDTDAAGMRTLRFVGREWILDKARVGTGELELIDGKRPFYQSSPGRIIRTLILEAQDRGAAQGIKLGNFTTDRDAAGNPWPKVATIYYSPGLPIASVLENLVEQGMCDYRMDGDTLNLFAPETAMGRDLTDRANPVRVHGAVTEAPVKYSLEDLASSALLIGDEGFELEVDNPSAPDDYGRLEVTIEQGGVSDAGTARIMVDEALQRGSREIREITRSQSAAGAAFLPYRDYRVGDYVQVLEDGQWQKYRVRELQLARDGQEWTIHTVINDRLQELLLKLAKRTSGIVNGSKGSGGDGTRPTPPENPGIEPAAPEGLIIDQQVYLDRQGIARGQVTAGWGAVTESTKGQAVEIGGYELWTRRNETHASWVRAASTDGDLTATHSPVVLSDADGNALEYQWRVRAIAQASNRPGPWSNTVTLTMTQDTEPPNAPSLPTVATDLRIVTVEWDGLDESAEAMPVDFSHLRIYFAAAEDMAGAEQVGSLSMSGVWTSGSMPADVPVWVAVSAVDNVGNESAMTPAQSVTPKKLVDDGSIRDAITGIDDKINNAVDDLNQAIDNIVVDANGTTTYWMPTEPDETTDPKPKVGDLWFDTSEEGKNKLHRFDGQVWVSAADERIDAIGGALDGLEDAVNQIITDGSGITTYWMPTEPDDATDPAPSEGDLWFDTSESGENRLSRFDGDQWVYASDGRIDAIKDAQDEFASDLDEVRVSANGKNSIHYSDRAPTDADPGRDGDVWWVGDSRAPARNIVLVGDSITEGVGTSTVGSRWQTLLQQRLSPAGAKYPFIPARSVAAIQGYPVERYGAVVTSGVSMRWGFGWRCAEIQDHSITDTDPGSIEFSFTGTSATLMFASGGLAGVASISVDGDAAVEFNTNSSATGGANYGLTWDTGQLPEGDHTVTVARSDSSTSGHCIWVEGILAFNGDEQSGTRLIDSGKSGIATTFWTDDANRLTGLVGTPSVDGAFQTLDAIDLVCIALGTNDYAYAVTPAEYQQNIELFISKSREAGYAGKFLLVGMYMGLNRDPVHWDEYHQSMSRIADSDGLVEYLDLRTRVPGPAETPENFADSVHPSDAGHAKIADAVEPYLRSEFVGGWVVSRQFVHDGNEWNETGVDGQVIANLDAGKIVSGYIDSARIKAGSLIADTILVPGSAGSTVIQDGAITTDKIEAGAITAESGIIASLDAGTITVGQMDGDRIAANTVTADKLLIGELSELAPSIASVPGEWEVYAPARIIDLTRSYDGKAIQFQEGADPRAFGPLRPTKPGDQWRASAYFENFSSGSGQGWLSVYFYTSSKSYISYSTPSIGSNEVSAIAVAPPGAAFARIAVRLSGDASGGPITARDVHGARLTGATLIEDGAITTDKIRAGAITSDSGIFGTMDAGILNAGEIDAARIGAKTITSDKLLVGEFVELAPSLGSYADEWELYSSAQIITLSRGYDGKGIQFLDGSDPRAFGPMRDTKPGDVWSVEAFFENYSGGTGQGQLGVYFYRADGSYIQLTTAATGSNSISGTATAPEEAAFARIAVRLSGDASGGPISARDVHGGRQASATLIEDGAITTDKILANAITAGKIAALAIEADHISANAITADKIRAGAIDGKLITGARIRTAASGRRTELDVEGLRSYDSSGNTVLTTQTSDGSIDMRGYLRQVSKGVEIEVGSNYRGGYPSIQWSDSTLWSYPPGVTYHQVDGDTTKRETFIQGPGTGNGNAYLGLQEYGDRFYMRAWKGSNETATSGWSVDGNMAENYMRLGNNVGPGPYIMMRRGTGDTGQFWAGYQHPSNGGYASLALRDRHIWLGAYDSNGNVVSRLWGDADSTRLTAGTRTLFLQGKGVSIDSSDKVYMPGIRRVTSAEHMGRDGDVVLISSARKYKILEEPIETTVDSFEDKLLSVDAKTWIDRSRADMIADYQTAIVNGETPEDDLTGMGGLERIPGVVAEDLVDAGLDLFVHFEDGEPESVLYDRIGPALIPIIRRLRDRVDALEQQLGATA